MGEIAEAMFDGMLCSVCGEYMGDEPNGFPSMCPGCEFQDEEEGEDEFYV